MRHPVLSLLQVFDPLHRSRPEFMQKVSMFSGDCSLPDLGLNEQDKQILLAEVDCVFHCAATVRFDENLRTATMTNVRAVRDLMLIAKKMKLLRVSVAYGSFVFLGCFYILQGICNANSKIVGDILLNIMC